MISDPSDKVMLLIHQAAAGEREAADALLPLVYEQLRAAAQLQVGSERTGHTLQATALVHEAYIRLIGPREVPWQNKAHFYVAAAEAMRRILLDYAKARARLKRGGARQVLSLDESAIFRATEEKIREEPDFIALDEAMSRLEGRDRRMAEVVRLKFYAGMEISQIALALGVSEGTVKNDWLFAKAWLKRALREPSSSDQL